MAAFHASAKSLLAGATTTARLRALRDTRPGFERSTWRALADAGWFAMLSPEGQGGLGLDLPHAAAIAEEIGRVLLPEPFVAAGVQAIATLCALPAGDLRDQLIARATAGEWVLGSAAGARGRARCARTRHHIDPR